MVLLRSGPSGPQLDVDLSPAFVVKTLADFPEPVNNVISLPDTSSWEIAATIDLGANRLELGPRVKMFGSAVTSVLLSTVQTGPLLSFGGADDGARLLGDISIVNTAGPCFEFVDFPASTIAFVGFVTCANSPKAGTVRNVDTFTSNDALVMVSCADGLTLSGTVASEVRLTNIVALFPNVANFIGVEIDSSFITNVLLIDKMSVDLTFASVTALDISDSATVTRGLVANSQFFGSGTPLATGAGKVSPSSLNWKFIGNQGIQDSGASADLRHAAITTTALVIGTQAEWITLSDLTFTLLDDERFVINGTGDGVIYKGKDVVNLNVNAAISAEKSGGGNALFSITVVKNDLTTAGAAAIGTTNPDGHEMPAELSQSLASIIDTDMNFCQVQEDDEFQILIRNLDGTDNAEAYAAALTITKA